MCVCVCVCVCVCLFVYIYIYIYMNPVGWSCRIHQLHFCKGGKPPPFNEYFGYDIKPSDVKSPALEIWGM